MLALLLSCAAPPAGDALPASAKSPPVRPFSLGLDLPAVPGAYLETDDDHDGWSEREGDCDDTTGAVSPRMWEDCTRIDDDCDGSTAPPSPARPQSQKAPGP